MEDGEIFHSYDELVVDIKKLPTYKYAVARNVHTKEFDYISIQEYCEQNLSPDQYKKNIT